jgi:twitching motility two-component system response regulator PilH
MSAYERKYLRVAPSPENPIEVIFNKEQLKAYASQIKVRDICLGGIGLEIPNAESILQPGTVIEYIGLTIPEEGKCVVSGVVKYVKNNKCGIAFLRVHDYELRKVARYVHKRELEIRELEKYKGEETLETTEEEKEEDNYCEPVEPEKKTTAEEPPPQKSKKILIIDDSPAIQGTYSTFFSKHGFEVLQAKDGAEGIKKAMETLPDIILMDINMPVLNGHETTRIIKSHPNTNHIPIVMFTTESEKDAVVRALKVGAKDYIIKTMNKEFVLERIRQFLGDK